MQTENTFDGIRILTGGLRKVNTQWRNKKL